MIILDNLSVSLKGEKKEILREISFTFNRAGTYLIKGRNGSGKSTLASTLMADPRFLITHGQIILQDEKYPDHVMQKVGLSHNINLIINDLDATTRSQLGIFLAHQYPLEIAGVDMSNYLRLIFNAHQPTPVPVFKFRDILKEKMEMINYPERLLKRNLNEGFSGGEKKRTEILQLALLSPRYAILDETDSGLDSQGIHDVFSGIRRLRETNSDMTVILISHYDKVNEYFDFDQVLEMDDGKIINTSGGK